MSAQNRYLPFFMWLFPLSFFAYQFILRLWPGLMMHSMMEQFSIDASRFGLLAAFYYYGYAGMQIPVAILLDRFPARKIIFCFAMLCSFATLLLSYTNHFYIAVFSRFLIGVGSAVGFLGVSKVISEWFPKEHYARMIGFSFTVGLMGAIYGGKPISLWLEHYPWQQVALMLALFSMLIGCTTYFLLRSPKQHPLPEATNPQFTKKHFKLLFASPVIWYLALANLLMVGSLEGFADVWGVPYLMTAFELTKGDAAGLVSFVFFGMLFGGPLLAFASKKFGHYPVIAACGIGMACAFALLLRTAHYHPWLLSSLFFVVGILCCYQVIVFAAGSQLVEPQQLGVTVAFLNCINMLGGSFFHTSIGKMMDCFWTGTLGADGLKIYDLETYQYALSFIPLCALLGVLLIFFVGLSVYKRKVVGA